MSASLVGSEMCIRDSPPPMQITATCQEVGALALEFPLPAANTSIWPPWPVSYTHLTLPTICSV
eukprot:15235389-Alexandrium_andersonii.AAC.1